MTITLLVDFECNNYKDLYTHKTHWLTNMIYFLQSAVTNLFQLAPLLHKDLHKDNY